MRKLLATLVILRYDLYRPSGCWSNAKTQYDVGLTICSTVIWKYRRNTPLSTIGCWPRVNIITAFSTLSFA